MQIKKGMIYTKSFSSDIAKVDRVDSSKKKSFSAETKTLYVEKDLSSMHSVYRFTGTAEVVDRDGEIVKADGLGVTDYTKNPVVLWSHDLRAEPIGRVVGIEQDLKNKRVYFDIIFAPTEDGARIEKLVSTGFLKAVSIGFVVDDYEFDEDVLTFTKTRMHEISLCSVPANQEALLEESKSMEENIKSFSPEDIEAIAQRVSQILMPKNEPQKEEESKKDPEPEQEPEALPETTPEVEKVEEAEEPTLPEIITITGNLEPSTLGTLSPAGSLTTTGTVSHVGTDSTQALVEILQTISDKLNFIQPTEANSDKTEQDDIRSEEPSPSEQTEEEETLSVEQSGLEDDPQIEIIF